MSGKKRKAKPPEWRPTAEEWAIERDFSVFVKNRCIFFHARAARYAKMFNFAARFTRSNVVVVLYIYGRLANPQTIVKRLAGVDHQMAVVHVPADENTLAVWDRAEDYKKQLKKVGLTPESFESDLQKYLDIPEEDRSPALRKHLQRQLSDLAILNDGTEAKRELVRQQRELPATVYANFFGPEQWSQDHNAELLRIIKALYPLGVEANGATEAAAKRLLIKKLIAAVISDETSGLTKSVCCDPRRLQLTLFDEENGAAELLNVIEAYITAELEKKSCFDISKIKLMLAEPPYGFYVCNYYAYILAAALKPYTVPPYRCFFRITDEPFAERTRQQYLENPFGVIFKETERQMEMSAALSEIFDLGERRDSFDRQLSAAIGWISQNIETPLACADKTWAELFRQPHEAWCDKRTAESLYNWLTDVDGRKSDLRRVDRLFYDRYEDHDKLDLFYKYRHVKGAAVGWLYPAEDFERELEKYMKSPVCRECGRPFDDNNTFGAAEIYQAEDYSIIRFSIKEIIGLNKKFLGRFQDEFYCIRCLGEILSMTPAELKEKIKRFKEQGCELF